MAELIGTTIGNYRVESLLGTGGMGQVYLGVHLHLNRPAAIKVMHAHLAGEESFKRRFRQEARSVAALSHPHIVQTWDFGTQDGNFYLVMELLTDGSLRSMLNSSEARQPGWPVHVGLDLVRQAAEGLAYAHHQGMVHRDIKPDNLLLQRQSIDYSDEADHDLSVKITDFGLARMTEEASATGPSLVMGTPAFVSPELCQGMPLDGRSDIYSLGVVLYQVVTGRLPFESRTAAEAVYKHVHAEPPRPSEHWPGIPAALESIILRCLSKDPDDRFATAAELSRALRGARAELVERGPALAPAGGFHHERTPSPLPVARPLPTPRSAAVAQLVVTSGRGGARQAVELGVDGVVVGSLPDNDLVLGDEGVFGRHLRIDWDGEQAVVTDLGSRTGTLLAGVPLQPHESRIWDADAEVRIGTRTLRLIPPTAVAAGGAAAATMALGRPLSGAAARASRWKRLSMLASTAVIAILLSVGGFQALSSGGDGGRRVTTASLTNLESSGPIETAVPVVALQPTETREPAATATPRPTGASAPTRAATRTATPTRTPTPRSTTTPSPTPPSSPPTPTSTPVPPTATVPPPTATPSPPAATPTPPVTTTAEPTMTQAPAPTTAPTAPTEAPTQVPTTPESEPTPEAGATAAPGSVPRPSETPEG